MRELIQVLFCGQLLCIFLQSDEILVYLVESKSSITLIFNGMFRDYMLL